jgi:hypothetical protein
MNDDLRRLIRRNQRAFIKRVERDDSGVIRAFRAAKAESELLDDRAPIENFVRCLKRGEFHTER